jgi:hypothetical protein
MLTTDGVPCRRCIETCEGLERSERETKAGLLLNSFEVALRFVFVRE